MILNLTQHKATVDQHIAGVVDLDVPMGDDCLATKFGFRQDQFGFFVSLEDCLTFSIPPTSAQMWRRAVLLAAIAVKQGATHAMIGGAPFFMPSLEKALSQRGIQPVYAFSVRDSVEEPDGCGGVRKVNVFRHAGFVTPDVDLGMPADDYSQD